MPELQKFQSQITFLYLKELQPAVAFFETILKLEKIDDQGWAVIYRVGTDSFIGAVAGENAFKKPQDDSAVLVTLCVNDVLGWYAWLKSQGVKILREPVARPDNQVHCFFFEGPGGYAFEIQEFMNPEKARIFHT
jgi:predicted enzyme related to lactoylglutathione lyase